jgi:origin recognition complex subunit 1
MPHRTTAATPRQQRAARAEKARKLLAGVARDDSDDELGYEDHPWEWIYDEEDGEEAGDAVSDVADEEKSAVTKRRRSKPIRNASRQKRIVGAKMGKFRCKIGDCVLLKAEGTNVAWVGIICGFMEDDEGGKEAKFMCKKARCLLVRFLTLHRVLLGEGDF